MNTRGVVLLLGSAQTLAWASSYYLPALLAAPIARELGLAVSTVFLAFSLGIAPCNAPLVLANAGGSRTIVSNVIPSRSFSRR